VTRRDAICFKPVPDFGPSGLLVPNLANAGQARTLMRNTRIPPTRAAPTG